MALFDEMMGRSVGSIRGVGATPEYTMVRVVAEEGTDYTVVDGEANYPDFRGLVMAQPRWTLGASHPFDSRAKAFQWVTTEMRGRTSAIVRVNYRKQDTTAEPPTSEWLWTYRTAKVQVQSDVELPPEVEGRFGNRPSERLSVSSTELRDDFWTGNARTIGLPRFVPVDERCDDPENPEPPGDVIGVVKGFDECGRDKNVALRVTDWNDASGALIDIPSVSLIATRIVPNFHASMVPALIRYHKAINFDKYLGAARYHISVEDVAIEPISYEMRGQRDVGRAYKVTVAFLWSDRPFVPLEKVATFPDDSGFAATVFVINGLTGAPRYEWKSQFRIRRREQLGKLLPLLAQGR